MARFCSGSGIWASDNEAFRVVVVEFGGDDDGDEQLGLVSVVSELGSSSAIDT